MIPVIIGVLIACGILGAIVADRHQAASGGFWLGLLFGPLGVIAAFALDRRMLCPQCNSRLNGHPKVCPCCHYTLGKNVTYL